MSYSTFPVSCLRGTARRGVALLLVLGLVALLGVLTTLLVQQLKVRLIETARREMRSELREAALAGLAAKLAEIAEYRAAEGAVYGPGQGLGGVPENALRYGRERGFEFRMSIRDESAYLPINPQDVAALAKLFRYLEIPDEASVRLSGALADWVDPDDAARLNGAERESYPEGAGPANAPIGHLDELLTVAGFAEWFADGDGLPNERFSRLAALVSVHGENPRPNINGAGLAVMSFLADEVGADGVRLLEARKQSPRGVFRREGELALAGAPGALASRIAFSASLLRIQVLAARGEVTGGVEAFVRIRPSGLQVESLVDSTEDANGATE